MERADWQLRIPAHRERCKYAFDNSLFCDVEFLVVDCDGNNVTVPANKYPLAVCSPVFEAMFYGRLAETNSRIHVPDCTDEGLREIFRYAYYEEATLTERNVMEVFYLAKKYMMPSLEHKCKYYIKNNVGPENVVSILPYLLKIGDQKLQKDLWEIVDKNTEKIVSSKSFIHISRELLYQILKRDALKVKEVNLFKAVDKWVVKRIEEDMELVCNGETKRAVLGEDMIKLIRFPLMTEKEFAEVVLPSKVLNLVEVTELISIYNGITPSTDIFSRLKRTSGDLLISDIRFTEESLMEPDQGLWSYHRSPDSLDFTVNKPVNLVGVRLFGNNNSTYNVKLSVNTSDPFVCLSVLSSIYATDKLMIDGLYYGFTVTLDKPV